MMCNINEEQLSAWLLGHLSSQAAEVTKNHIEQCRQCTQVVAELKVSINRMASHDAEVTLPLGLKQRILARAQAGIKPQRHGWLAWQKGALSFAATMVVAVSLASLWQVSNKAEQAVIQSYGEDLYEFYNYSNDEVYQSNGNTIYGVPSEVTTYLN